MSGLTGSDIGSEELESDNYWYLLGLRKVILHDSIMTCVSVIPATLHENLDSITYWSRYGGIWGAQFSKYLHYAPGVVMHDLPGGQYIGSGLLQHMYHACSETHKKWNRFH